MDLIVQINLEGLSPDAREAILENLSYDLRKLADYAESQRLNRFATHINFERRFNTVNGSISIKG